MGEQNASGKRNPNSGMEQLEQHGTECGDRQESAGNVWGGGKGGRCEARAVCGGAGKRTSNIQRPTSNVRSRGTEEQSGLVPAQVAGLTGGARRFCPFDDIIKIFRYDPSRYLDALFVVFRVDPSQLPVVWKGHGVRTPCPHPIRSWISAQSPDFGRVAVFRDRSQSITSRLLQRGDYQLNTTCPWPLLTPLVVEPVVTPPR